MTTEFKLVPVEPTTEMMAVEVSPALCLGDPETPRVEQWRRGVYKAMLAAAPTPPQPIYDEVKERELFEVRIHRIAVEKGYSFLSCLFLRDKGGEYRTTWVDMAWLGWSERAQSRTKAGEVGS